MLLAIEQGNTNTLFAIHDGSDWIAQWRTSTYANRTADEYAVWLNQLLAIEGFVRQDIANVIISTVVPRALHNLQLLAQKYFGVEALIAGREPVSWGIALKVDEPQSVGADRAVNAISAQAVEPGRLAQDRYRYFVDRAYHDDGHDWGVFSLSLLSRTPEFRHAAA